MSAQVASSITTSSDHEFISGQSDATVGQKPDIYGQVHPIETPELVERKYHEFKTELSNIIETNPDGITNNLQKAMKLCPECFTNEFQLKFLQCEVYNVKLAVKRYINYFNKRVEILGEEKAFKIFNIMSLDSDVLFALEAGVLHVIHRPNPNDRTLLYIDYANFHSKINRQSFIMSLWYLLHVMAIDDPECPKKGAIIIADAGRFQFSQCDKALIKLIINSIKECLPIRLSAYHLCYPPTFVSFFIPIVFLFLNKRLKQRLIVSNGNKAIVIHQLSDKYHIEACHLPTQVGGILELNMKSWIMSRKQTYGMSDLWNVLEKHSSTTVTKVNNGNTNNDSDQKALTKSLPLPSTTTKNGKSVGLASKSLQQPRSQQQPAGGGKTKSHQSLITDTRSVDETLPIYRSCSSTESSINSNHSEDQLLVVHPHGDNDQKEQQQHQATAASMKTSSCILSVHTLLCGSFFPIFDNEENDDGGNNIFNMKSQTKQQQPQLSVQQQQQQDNDMPLKDQISDIPIPFRERRLRRGSLGSTASASTMSSSSTSKSRGLRGLASRLKKKKYDKQQTV